MADIRTTVSTRTAPRADLEKLAADALLQKKISLSEYRELVKPNLTEADLEADMTIAARIMVDGLKQEQGSLISTSMGLANKLIEAIKLDASPALQAKIDAVVHRVSTAIAAAEIAPKARAR